MKRDDFYWRNKVAAYLHDQIVKPFDLGLSEENFKTFLKNLGIESTARNDYMIASDIASSIARVKLPGHSDDSHKNGDVFFKDSPFITHPVSASEPLKAILPNVDTKVLCLKILELIDEDLAYLAKDKTFDAEERARLIYNYLFFALTNRLSSNNTGGLGNIWEHLPADARMPDNSLINHQALTSAIFSSMEQDSEKQVKMVVFSITPVQGFIAKARKLRDLWSGSVILSYLSFKGIQTVSKELGPDHVLYPSLHDQPLINKMLSDEFGLEEYLKHSELIDDRIKATGSVASFPNKFVFLAPASQCEDICKTISNAVKNEWIRLSELVIKELKLDKEVASMFSETVDDYWTMSYAGANLVHYSDIQNLSKFLNEAYYKKEIDLCKQLNNTGKDGEKILYGSTHSLVQSVLSAEKLKPKITHYRAYGKICPQCGENEVLHNPISSDCSITDYTESADSLWSEIAEIEGLALKKSVNKVTGKKTIEELCPICLIKRALPFIMKKRESEILHEVFSDIGFPSTTEMALRSNNPSANEEAKKFRATDEGDDDALNGVLKNSNFKTYDRYYSILLMDGDKMGDLINGKTIGASWKTVINPDLVKRFEDKSFSPDDNSFKKEELITQKKGINPPTHAMISDSLNYFSRFAVSALVDKYYGKLIYAGGDDVCAIVPTVNVLSLAEEISKCYNHAFYAFDGKDCVGISGEIKPDDKRIFVGLGSSPGISISAGIAIVHHKDSLSEALDLARHLLDEDSKNKAGRNACSIGLNKRSGGLRKLSFKWNTINRFADDGRTVVDSFNNIINAVANDYIPATTLYKFQQMETFLKAFGNNDEHILKAIEYELNHTSNDYKGKINDHKDLVKDLAGIMFNEDYSLNTDAPIVASFMGKGECND